MATRMGASRSNSESREETVLRAWPDGDLVARRGRGEERGSREAKAVGEKAAER